MLFLHREVCFVAFALSVVSWNFEECVVIVQNSQLQVIKPSQKEKSIVSQEGYKRVGLEQAQNSIFLHFLLGSCFLPTNGVPSFLCLICGNHDPMAASISYPKISIPREEDVLTHKLQIQNPWEHLHSLAWVLCLLLNQSLRPFLRRLFILGHILLSL